MSHTTFDNISRLVILCFVSQQFYFRFSFNDVDEKYYYLF